MRNSKDLVDADAPSVLRAAGYWGKLSIASLVIGSAIGLCVTLVLERPDIAEGALVEHRAQSSSNNTTDSGSDGLQTSSNADNAPLKASIIDARLTKARPFEFSGPKTDRERAADCLAAAAWYEIGDDRIGQRAVIQTVINRVNHASFPKSICGVVFEGSQRETGCQFTFTCDGSLRVRKPSGAAWRRALAVANAALDGYVDGSIGSATHYHADYVTPWWSSELTRLNAVGPHIFYRWSGSRGALRSPARLDAEMDYAALVQRSSRKRPKKEQGSVAQEAARLAAPAQTSQSLASAPVASAAAPARNTMNAAIILKVDSQQPSGRWAIAAMKACSGRSGCQVIAYDDAAAVSINRSRHHAQLDRPQFLFLRDEASGMDIALWDCESVARPSEVQCLPAEGPALRSLLAAR